MTFFFFFFPASERRNKFLEKEHKLGSPLAELTVVRPGEYGELLCPTRKAKLRTDRGTKIKGLFIYIPKRL